MNIAKLMYIWDSGKYYAENACEQCGVKPAVSLEADCHGDSLTLCKPHWLEWFNNELLPKFDKPLDEYVQVETEKYGLVYIDKPKFDVVP